MGNHGEGKRRVSIEVDEDLLLAIEAVKMATGADSRCTVMNTVLREALFGGDKIEKLSRLE